MPRGDGSLATAIGIDTNDIGAQRHAMSRSLNSLVCRWKAASSRMSRRKMTPKSSSISSIRSSSSIGSSSAPRRITRTTVPAPAGSALTPTPPCAPTTATATSLAPPMAAQRGRLSPLPAALAAAQTPRRSETVPAPRRRRRSQCCRLSGGR